MATPSPSKIQANRIIQESTSPNVNPKTTIKSRRKSIIRIKPAEKKNSTQEIIDYGSETFSQEHLTKYWDIYAAKTKQLTGGFSGSVLTNCNPKLNPDQKTIHVIFRTDTNQTEFLRLSDDLLIYLKSELKNNNIVFDTEVNKEKAKKILYSNRDKFDHYSEQFPNLKDWENKLGLELN